MKSNNTIPATLDLTQSLKSFECEIAGEMSLSDVSQWNRRNIREQEQKIRQAALILAGECIALLLHKLSESNRNKISVSAYGSSTLQLEAQLVSGLLHQWIRLRATLANSWFTSTWALWN